MQKNSAFFSTRISPILSHPSVLTPVSTSLDIRITKTELNRDSRLRVCFESDLKDSLYLLALENEEGDVQEFPQLRPYVEDGLTCVLSNDAIQEEGYVVLWTLLTAYDVSGAEVQASGSTSVADFCEFVLWSYFRWI